MAGIGFTVALLIADITFTGEDLEDAKLGILAASVLASGLAWIVFRAIDHLPRWLALAGQGRLAPPLLDLTEPVDPEIDHVRGPADGPVTLVEYGDFEWTRRDERHGAVEAADRVRRADGGNPHGRAGRSRVAATRPAAGRGSRR